MAEDLKKTPLHDLHAALGAQMFPFGGWTMPLRYGDILEEHRAVRERAGLFDVSHMGEIVVRGPRAGSLVQELVTNDISGMEDGQAVYSPMCAGDGGVLDDLLVYRLEAGHYMLVVNAANTGRDLAWVRSHAGEGVEVEDVSGRTALLALQGPRAAEVLKPLAGFDPGSLGSYRFVRGPVAGVECLVSRTGYTGEDGFEIYLDAGDGAGVWQALMESGRNHGLVPAGLGARDTLRLEASLPLYGHELNEKTTPLEAGLGRFVKLDKGPFTGREALQRQQREGLSRRLVGLSMLDRGVPRAGYPVLVGDDPAGAVTSGGYAPTLNACLAMAYVTSSVNPGDRVAVLIRGKKCGAAVVPLPFYKKSARREAEPKTLK
ncbi:MAG: glycine cleavage system aminomethyltransferase GcvT [Peptococcaceae bacterium]|nr:glycine cleavage system aminomethyltransferase GcvT [Peptococcaceae bacterium]